ncbi:hypothetical protein DPMN_186136 [Dreissena polymorpha]|uniref:Uncharacterized protein n=1 Tax=Dreissena polymorpha TaxID=45954 RepID=A0A9D4I7X7_DREPO|nr:hypothetical protein DPMN_186136 [Dreissena polymorpha]
MSVASVAQTNDPTVGTCPRDASMVSGQRKEPILTKTGSGYLLTIRTSGLFWKVEVTDERRSIIIVSGTIQIYAPFALQI